MIEASNDDSGSELQSMNGSGSENTLELREARNRLQWAGTRARLHLVRLGKWRRERGDPTNADLSGAATLVRVGNRKGILTAAHNIRCKFPAGRDAHKGETMGAIFGKHGGPAVVWTDVDLTNAIVEGGSHSKGEPEDMGPDIAWIPLEPEKASFFERYGKVFFDCKDNKVPATSGASDVQTGNSRRIAVGHLVAGFSGEREKAASHVSGLYLLEVVQDVFFPDREWAIKGWDYEERVLDSGGESDERDAVFDDNVPMVTRAEIPLRVDHEGGMSGGGLWRCGGDENDRHFDLVGVVWYQRWRDEYGVVRIVNHGRESIRKIIMSE